MRRQTDPYLPQSATCTKCRHPPKLAQRQTHTRRLSPRLAPPSQPKRACGQTHCNALTGVKARRWRVGLTLSPCKYWTGVPSDGGRAPYSAVPIVDLSWSSKLARCLSRQCKRMCAKAETNSAMSLVLSNVPFFVRRV